MAEVGNLTVKVGIDGANKAVQDLEKIRRQLELINTLARNVAASFATVNTQLRTFDNITKSMDNATRSGEKYNYTLRNTARIIGDISRGNGGRGIGDALQTLAAGKVLSGTSFNRDFSRMFSAFRAATGGRGGIGDAAVGAYEQGLLRRQLAFQRTPFGREVTRSPLFRALGYTDVQRNAGGAGRGLLGGGFGIPSGVANYAANFGNTLSNNGMLSALATPFSGNSYAGLSMTGMAGIGAAAGFFAATIGALVSYMKMLSQAVLQGASAMSGFVRMAVDTAAQFQSIKSSNVSGILGSQFGGVYNEQNLKAAKNISNQQFNYMRKIAEKSVYTLPDIAGAANILTQNNIPLNKFLETTAVTGQAKGLRGKNVEEVARIFARLAYGDFPDREIGAKYGLVATNPALRAAGLRFDKNNSMMNSPQQAVNIVQDFLSKRFGSGFKVSAKDYETKFATLMDKVASAMEKVGRPIMTALIPAFEQLGRTIDFLSKSGIFDMLGQSMATFISQTMDLMKGDEFKRTLAFVFASINEIPNQLYIMAQSLMKVVNIISRTKPMDFLDLLDPVGASARNLGIRIAGGKVRQNPLLELGGAIGELASGQISAVENIMNMTNMFYGMMMKPPVKPQKTQKDLQEEKFKSDLPGKAAEEGNKKLQQLVDNSKKLIDLFDLRKQTIGLGPLSQIGVTGVELAAAGMPMINSHKIDPSNYSSISIGPVRGINQLEKGINALQRENQNKAKAGRGIRTSR